MIIQNRKPANGQGEDSRKLSQAIFDPFLAVDRSFADATRGALTHHGFE
jgi:hypothetical protein